MSSSPLQTLDAESFRRELAGLVVSKESETFDSSEFRQCAVDLGVILCRVYSEQLDRTALWDRIATAFATACSKVPNGEPEQFLSAVLEHVKADPAAAAREESVSLWLAAAIEHSDEWRRSFVRYLVTRSYAVIVHARNAWEVQKEARRG